MGGGENGGEAAGPPGGAPPAKSAGAGLSSARVRELHAEVGFNEVLTEAEPEWKKFFGRYLGIVPIAMLVAAILSAAIGSGGCFEDEAILDAEAAIGSGLLVGACTCDEGRDWFSFALLIFEVNLIVVVDYFGERSAQDAVKALKEMSAPTCRARRDGEWLEVPVRELVPGDVVELAAGIIIPSDGTLVGKGEPMLIDESSLTGESLAVTKYPGDEVLSGAVVMQGELDMEVSRTGPATFFGKTIALLSNVKTQGNVQKLLGTVAKIMCLVGLLGCIPIFFVLLFRDGQEWAGALKLAIVVLVAVLPVAMPLVVTTALAVGALELSREQAIVQRLSAIEEMAGMNILCSDKTGTLTKNELELDFEEVWCRAGTTVRDVLLVACLAAKIHGGQDAIDKAVTRALDALPEADGGGLAQLEAWRVDKFIPFNPVDKRTEATCVDAEGRGHVYSKGAPNVMVALAADSPQVRAAAEDRILANAERGLRSLGVARLVDVPGDAGASAGKMWQLLGLIALLDPPRDDTAATILEAQEKGVEVKMITGDARAIAVETCARLHMGTNIIGAEIWSSEGDALLRAKGSLGEVVEEVNGFASVFPEHKYRIVESLQDRGHLVGMTGDGVNDAPALKRANVGIAVAGATDAAKAAADIVLTAPGLSTIITAINQSRKIFARLQGYIMYRMASSVLILGFFFLSIIALGFNFPTWVLILLSLVNDFTAMATSKDSVRAAPAPLRWNMVKVTGISVLIGISGFLGSFLLLYLALPQYGNWWPALGGLRPLFECEVVAVMYLNLAWTIQLNIFATRNKSFSFITKKAWGGARLPSLILCTPVVGSMLLALFLAVYWDGNWSLGGGASMSGISWGHAGATVIYSLVWFLVTDAVKVLGYRLIETSESLFYDNIVGESQEAAAREAQEAYKAARVALGENVYRRLGLKKELETHTVEAYNTELSMRNLSVRLDGADGGTLEVLDISGLASQLPAPARDAFMALEHRLDELSKRVAVSDAEVRQLVDQLVADVRALQGKAGKKRR